MMKSNGICTWLSIAIVIGLTLVMAGTADAATYYVDSKAGNDSKDGLSQSTAWKTLEKVGKASFSPGDTVLFKRGSVWREGVRGLVWPSSGEAGKPITIDAYGEGAKPLILGSDRVTEWKQDAGTKQHWRSPSYPWTWHVGFLMFGEQVPVPVEGKDIGYMVLQPSDLVREGQFAWDWDTHQVVLYCENAAGPNAVWPIIEVGIRARSIEFNGVGYVTMRNMDLRYGTAGGVTISQGAHHILIEECAVSYGGGGATGFAYRAGDVIKIDSNAHDITVRNCSVSQAFDYGLSVETWSSDERIYNILVENNHFDRCAGGMNITQPYANDVTNCRISNVTYRNNLITNMGYGWATLNGVPGGLRHSGSGGGIWILENAAENNWIENIVIEGNTIEHYAGTGLHFQNGSYTVRGNILRDGTMEYEENTYMAAIVIHGDGYNESVGDVTGTFSHNVVDTVAAPAFLYINNTPETGTANVTNNTFYNCGTSTRPSILMVNGSGLVMKNNLVFVSSADKVSYLLQVPNTGYTFDYNNYYKPSGDQVWIWGSTFERDGVSSYTNYSKQDTNSTWVNPLCINPAGGNFHLQSTSPLVSAGISVGLTTDIEGTKIPADAVSIGAYQYSEKAPDEDTTKPVIALQGAAVVTLEVGSAYTDAGATASDDVDGNISANIQANSTVNTAAVGAYTVTYTVSDAAGNVATPVVRTVNLVDTTPPVLTLQGTAVVTVQVGSSYSDAGATAIDAYQGNISGAIVVNNPVNMARVGVYTITYTVADSSGNAAVAVVRTVNVVDTTKPVITRLGNATVSVSVGVSYTDAGARATDNYDGDITSRIQVNNPVNTSRIGSYTVTYNVSDAAGNAAATVTRTVTVGDATAPVITLRGQSPVTVEVGAAYSDAGATATDNYDGDITSRIQVSNPVDTRKTGSYTVTYNVSDAAGNAATAVSRTVNVVDTTKPVISLRGQSPVTVEAGASYSDAGATATDSYDGDITSRIQVSNPVDTRKTGSYTVTYNVSDAAGNAATAVSRTVTVVDTTKPVISLQGPASVAVEAGAAYNDAGASATDTYDGDITSRIQVSNPVDTRKTGSYTVTYNVSDAAGNAATAVSRTVTVTDTTAPVISLRGAATVNVEAGASYSDAGATAADTYDGDITSRIRVSNPVDTSKVGTYTVTYNVSDAAGNAAAAVTRTVTVALTAKPVITLQGEATVTLEVGTSYSDAGATAQDALGADLTAQIVVNNSVDAKKVGVYTVTYNVSDAAGNAAAAVTRTVNVVDTTVPVISLVGEAQISIYEGASYSDAGATATDSYDGDITSRIQVNNPVDTAREGLYNVTYNVSDAAGNAAAEVRRVVEVIARTKPSLIILGAVNTDAEAGVPYIDMGAVAIDEKDGDISEQIKVDNPVDSETLGVYTVTYTVTNSIGATATKTRTVTVSDTSAPVLTLIGPAEVSTEVMSSYTDPGVSAIDSFEGDITLGVTVENKVDTTQVGSYTVTYRTSDSAGNAAIAVTRTVNVVDTTAPTIEVLE